MWEGEMERSNPKSWDHSWSIPVYPQCLAALVEEMKGSSPTPSPGCQAAPRAQHWD